MKKMNRTNLKVAGLLALIISVGTATSGHAQTLVEQLQASNYNATTGVWTATVGSSATSESGTGIGQATLATSATPNGSSAVAFNGTDILDLTTPVTNTGSYTVFVFAEPTKTDGSFFGGSGGGGALQYRVTGDKQDVVQQGQADPGEGTASVSNTTFSLFDATASSSGVSYRLNGSADGSVGGVNISNPINYIGSNQPGTSGELFTGDIAEIDIYNGVLTSAQIATQEAALTAEYATAAPTPEPSTWALLLGGLGSLVMLSRFRKVGQV